MSEPTAQADPARPGKAYTAPGLTVYYDAARCIHFAACVRRLPDVFVPGQRPWIQADQAAPETVAEVVRRCPTGALHYQLAAGPEEAPEVPTRITPLPDGPLAVRGDLIIQTPEGEHRETRVALCRCGQSGHKPFCDGTHAKVGWTDQT